MTWGANLVPALEHLAEMLTAAGVPATTDRARLAVPGAWVTPATGNTYTLGGAGTVRASVLLVAPQAGDLEALKTLGGLLDLALTVLTPDEDVELSVRLPVNNNPLPAFRLAVDLDLEE